MTHKQVAALAVRVLAIYAIINSLGWLQSSLTLFSMVFGRTQFGSISLWQYALALLPFCFFAASGILLWIFADAVAYFMCFGEERNAPAPRLAAVEILTLALGIIGVWFALSALPRLLQNIAASLFSYTNAARINVGGPLPMELTIGGAQIAIGLIIFFAARPIAERVATHYRFTSPVENAVEPEAENIS